MSIFSISKTEQLQKPNMNNSNQYSLKDAFGQLLKQYGLEDTMLEQKIIDAWKTTVGEYCAQCTTEIRFKSGQLSVRISSSIVRQELMYAKTEIISKLNILLENDIVSSIKIK